MKFSVVASFTGVLPEYDSSCYYSFNLGDVKRVCDQMEIPYDITEPGDSEYNYLAEGKEDTWYSHMSDLTLCAFMTRSEFKTFVSELGAYAEDCLTMGTLGGPLGIGIVPDIPMNIESDVLITSIRVTPCPEVNGEPIYIDNERQWNVLRSAFISAYAS